MAYLKKHTWLEYTQKLSNNWAIQGVKFTIGFIHSVTNLWNIKTENHSKFQSVKEFPSELLPDSRPIGNIRPASLHQNQFEIV